MITALIIIFVALIGGGIVIADLYRDKKPYKVYLLSYLSNNTEIGYTYETEFESVADLFYEMIADELYPLDNSKIKQRVFLEKHGTIVASVSL